MKTNSTLLRIPNELTSKKFHIHTHWKWTTFNTSHHCKEIRLEVQKKQDDAFLDFHMVPIKMSMATTIESINNKLIRSIDLFREYA